MTEWLAYGLVAGFAALRLSEMAWARRNHARLLALGAREFHAEHYLVLVGLHAAFFAAIVAELSLAPWAGFHAATPALLALFALALGLRAWVLSTLGPRWTTRILVRPTEHPIRKGPYRFLRHPNYVAIIVEVSTFPLALGLPATAAAFTTLHALALRRRIRQEEAAWRAVAAEAL